MLNFSQRTDNIGIDGKYRAVTPRQHLPDADALAKSWRPCDHKESTSFSASIPYSSNELLDFLHLLLSVFKLYRLLGSAQHVEGLCFSHLICLGRV